VVLGMCKVLTALLTLCSNICNICGGDSDSDSEKGEGYRRSESEAHLLLKGCGT